MDSLAKKLIEVFSEETKKLRRPCTEDEMISQKESVECSINGNKMRTRLADSTTVEMTSECSRAELEKTHSTKQLTMNVAATWCLTHLATMEHTMGIKPCLTSILFVPHELIHDSNPLITMKKKYRVEIIRIVR